MKENPEEVFFKYAYPCSSTLLQLGTINEAQFDLLNHYFEKNKTPDRDLLEICFPVAIKRLKRFASNSDYWNVDNIREYFFVHHNQVIDNKEGFYADVRCNDQVRELCKVQFCDIQRKETVAGNVVYHVEELGGEQFKVSGKYLPDAKIGDRVSVHWRFAIEKF